jgi:tryptophan-rich sensory protein
MGFWMVALFLALGAFWDAFTTFYGISIFFDVPMDPKINPVQFAFGLVVTMVIFGFVMATHLIWSHNTGDKTPALIVKVAWGVSIAIDILTSFEGTKNYVFYGEDGDPARDAGLAVITALIVSSSIFLSALILKNGADFKSLSLWKK